MERFTIVIRRKSFLPLMASSLTRMLLLLSADTRTRLRPLLLATLLIRHRRHRRLRTAESMLLAQEHIVRQRLFRVVAQFIISRAVLLGRSRVSFIDLIALVRFLMPRCIC